MEAMREQHPLPKHPLVSSPKLDLGDGKRVSQMKGSVHIWDGEVSKPLGELFFDFCWREASDFLRGGGIDLENLLVFPSLLVLAFKLFEIIALAGLKIIYSQNM
jgi:hypothetical protein